MRNGGGRVTALLYPGCYPATVPPWRLVCECDRADLSRSLLDTGNAPEILAHVAADRVVAPREESAVCLIAGNGEDGKLGRPCEMSPYHYPVLHTLAERVFLVVDAGVKRSTSKTWERSAEKKVAVFEAAYHKNVTYMIVGHGCFSSRPGSCNLNSSM